MNAELNLFKVEYHWVEGEYNSSLLGKAVEREEFEKDLLKAKEFAQSLMGKEIKGYDYLGVGYTIECLPQFYAQIVWFLIEKLGYLNCRFQESISYDVDDWPDKKIMIHKSEIKTERRELPCSTQT